MKSDNLNQRSASGLSDNHKKRRATDVRRNHPLLLILLGLCIAGILILLLKPAEGVEHRSNEVNAAPSCPQVVTSYVDDSDNYYEVTCYSAHTNCVVQHIWSHTPWNFSEYEDVFELFEVTSNERIRITVSDIYCSMKKPRMFLVEGIHE